MRTLSLFSLPHIRDGRKMQKVIYLIIYTRAWGARIYFKRMFSTVPCVLKCLRFINGSVNKRVVSLFSPRGKAEPPFWPFCIFLWSGYCSRPHITTCPCVWKKSPYPLLYVRMESPRIYVWHRSVCAKPIVRKREIRAKRLLKIHKKEKHTWKTGDVTKNSPEKPRKWRFSIDKHI